MAAVLATPVHSRGGSMKCLGLCGSLRVASTNRALLGAMQRLAPSGCELDVYDGLGGLPLFNPDLECHEPSSVAALRMAVVNADLVLIASPEYAHGVSGVMKNALDWLVGSEAFVRKPVAVLNASPRAHHAYDALCETLDVMSALRCQSTDLNLPILGSGLDAAGIAQYPDLARRIGDIWAALLPEARQLQNSTLCEYSV
ncbi:NADPH-dependent FMN reductase [Chitinibacteraceae bacterium HSL-7]